MLGWVKGPAQRRDFKSGASFELFEDYVSRISRFAACSVLGSSKNFKKDAGARLWLCDTSKRSRGLSSEEISREIGKLQAGGIKELFIAIGPPDGWSEEDIALMKPDIFWSLGPMTLPHELAGIVAAEQIYRAHTILKKLPYHCGH